MTTKFFNHDQQLTASAVCFLRRYISQYMLPINVPPTVLPRVIGTRLFMKSSTLRLVTRTAVTPAALRTSVCPLSAMPIGMRYIFAMLCSKQQATDAVIGKSMAKILSTVLWAPKHSHTARHTRALYVMPREKAVQNEKFTLALAMSNAFAPTL